MYYNKLGHKMKKIKFFAVFTTLWLLVGTGTAHTQRIEKFAQEAIGVDSKRIEYVQMDGTVLVSEDKGVSWKRADNGEYIDADKRLTLVYHRADGAVFVSRDKGRTWYPDRSRQSRVAATTSLPIAESVVVRPQPASDLAQIEYRLGSEAHVELGIIDLNGNEVLMLVNATQAIGSYTVNLEAGKLVPGVYYFRLKKGGEIVVGKISIIK